MKGQSKFDWVTWSSISVSCGNFYLWHNSALNFQADQTSHLSHSGVWCRNQWIAAAGLHSTTITTLACWELDAVNLCHLLILAYHQVSHSLKEGERNTQIRACLHHSPNVILNRNSPGILSPNFKTTPCLTDNHCILCFSSACLSSQPPTFTYPT